SDNVTHLLVSNFSGADGDDLDTDDDGVLDVTPWDEVVDLMALILQENPPTSTEYHYGPPTVGPDGEFVPGHAFLCEEGWQVGAFGGGQDTPGEENNCGGNGGEQCGDPVTFIHEIQGSGNSSPLIGQNVSLEGIVVGDFQNNASPDDGDLNGFYVQEEAADQDDNPLTSEGIFVFAPAADDVAPGDHVRVSGTVVEFDGLTEISPASDVQVCAAGELPEPVDVFLPMTSPDDFERYEGMLVRLPQQLVITEYFNFDRFNEIVISLPATGPDRPSQPTAVAEPGSPEAEAIALQNALSRITVDDGRTTQNPDPALHPNGEVFDLDNLFRGGDLLENTTGILDHRFALYRIQ